MQNEIESFEIGSIIPVVVVYYTTAGKEAICNSIAKPQPISTFANEIVCYIENDDFEKASLSLFIIAANIAKKYPEIEILIRYFKSLNKKEGQKEIKKTDIKSPENPENRKAFKQIEKRINDLIRQQTYEGALKSIDEELKHNTIDNKYKSSLLLKKAQIYSSLNNPTLSEHSYQELIRFNELIKSPDNNLSHLYTELARLQAQNIDKSTSP
ncbi:MAG: hypothetical protein IPJ86_06430 [Bacteroidetes bacterium]|nr:hypothetical protein [Bacteroidota bacterium]